jgi:NAD(P)-dependent dehydrogenase (short-subunit alcohol dehydrogenase family)
MSQRHQSRRMEGRVALVTGGGSGIGRAAALAYCREGATVVVAGRRSEELDETVRLIVAEGGEASAIPTDVAIAQQVRELVDLTIERYGRLDAAFNNAGIEGAFAPIAEMPEADFDEVIAINLRGAWLSIKYEIAAMHGLGNGGAIVNTSSFLAKGASSDQPPIPPAKGRSMRLSEPWPSNMALTTFGSTISTQARSRRRCSKGLAASNRSTSSLLSLPFAESASPRMPPMWPFGFRRTKHGSLLDKP